MKEAPAMPSAEKPKAEISVDKQKLLGDLEAMLNDVYGMFPHGENASRYIRDEKELGTEKRRARAHGYIDGYMRLLQETGIATREEIVAKITEARERSKKSAA